MRRSFILSSALSLAFTVPLISGTISYNVSVNTSAVSGTSGSLEFTLSSGIVGNPLISATISNFSINGSLVGAPSNLGNVSGALPGTVSIDNGNLSFALASMLQQITYGSGFNFRLTIDTVAVDPGPPLTSLPLLAVYIYNSSFNPLLTNDPFGSILVWETDALRNPIVSTFDSDGSGSPSIVSISEIPEPATLSLIAAGLAAIWFRKRKAA